MTFVHIPSKTAELPFHAQRDACCNCGEIEGISLVETPLKRTSYMLIGGTELTLTVHLPYCVRCAKTSSRFPQGLFAKVLIAAGLSFALMLVAVVIPVDIQPIVGDHLPLAATIGGVLLTFAFFSLRKPSGSQTSYYQPVTLKGVKQKFLGDIVGVTLYCTNPDFAHRYTMLNQEFVASGFLKVEHR